MPSTGKLIDPLLAALVVAAGLAAWWFHAQALDLGRSSSLLGYDAAQYAVAARELAERGRLATPFALPIELARNANPPWPLALVQPGLVLAEGLVLRVTSGLPDNARLWWLLFVPLGCFLATAVGLALAARQLIDRHAPQLSEFERTGGALVVGLAFVLDPEAQHYASGGFTELPFTLGLAIAVFLLSSGAAPPPLRLGLLLGVTGLFRGNMLWLAPIVAGCAALAPARGRAVFGRVLLGYGLVLLPWWIYKTAAFGNPAWDLSALSLWDGVGGRTWFSLNHLPEAPLIPSGTEAIAALWRKIGSNLPTLLLALASGPRTLWIGALALIALGSLAAAEPREGEPARRAQSATALAILLVLAASVLAAALTVPLLRYLLPARLLAEAAGLVATWALVWRSPREWMSPGVRRALCAALAALAIAWGALQTGRGVREARMVSGERGTPTGSTLDSLAAGLDARLSRGEPVMSNLGPALAWHARRPVIHLALTPADIDACRRRTDFRLALLAFRNPAQAWPGWTELLRDPMRATHHRDWNIRHVRVERTRDGFMLVWLELGPLGAPLARGAPSR